MKRRLGVEGKAVEVGRMSEAVAVVEVDGRPVGVDAVEVTVEHPVSRLFVWEAQHQKGKHLPALETGSIGAAPSRMGLAPGLEP